LLECAKALTPALRAYCYGALAERASDDERAWAATTEVLTSDDLASVRAMSAAGLGRSKSERAVAPLRAALYRGDGASRAAAAALAQTGSRQAIEILKTAVTDAPDEAMAGAVLGIVQLEVPCPDCLELLRKQHKSHPDEGVRDLIGIVLELEKKHDH
jgi:HEAT repeat protein